VTRDDWKYCSAISNHYPDKSRPRFDCIYTIASGISFRMRGKTLVHIGFLGESNIPKVLDIHLVSVTRAREIGLTIIPQLKCKMCF
jgi:hypothetical protein